MPIVPNLLERLVLLRLNRGPGAILDLFAAGSFHAASLAGDLGVFEALAEGPAAAPELATMVEADPDGLEVLLAFLVATGYLRETDGRYANTAMTTRWLLPGQRGSVAPWLAFWDELVFPFWAEHLEAAVRTGGPPLTLYEYCDAAPGRWEIAQRGFRAVASILVDGVADAVDVPEGATRLLDVGGGHGLFSVGLCERHPALSATVFDDPAALGVAEEEVERANLEGRVSVQGGDYRTDDLGDGYDVALVFNVVHAHDGDENAALLSAVADALAPGGRVAVLDQFEGSARTPVAEAGLGFVGLAYLATLGGEVHPYDSVASWLRAAGFEDLRRTTFRAAPGTALVQATLA